MKTKVMSHLRKHPAVYYVLAVVLFVLLILALVPPLLSHDATKPTPGSGSNPRTSIESMGPIYSGGGAKSRRSLQSTTGLANIQTGWEKMKSGSVLTKYKQQNPGEMAKIDAYVADIAAGRTPAEPQLATFFGDGLTDIIATAVAVVPVPTPTPPPVTLGRFGIANGWRLPWLSATDRTRYLDSAKAMGTNWARFDIDWNSIQNGGPTSYNWTAQDAVVNDLKARGIATLGVIAYTPPWARASGTTDKYPPTNNADYGNFCGATARHYAPMGVHTWEVWNEPNITVFWLPQPDPVKYTAMLKLCYAAIKAADPSATVITAGNSPAGSYNSPGNALNINQLNFLERVYQAGGKGFFDAVAAHPYSFPAAPGFAATWSAWYQMYGTTPSVRSIMTANGDGDKKIWATEWGEPTNGVAGDGHVTEAQQAADVTTAFQLYGSYAWAGPLFVHNFRDDGTSTSTRENFFGLIRWDFSLKPGYTAFKNAASAG